ncbi:MAG: nucleotidyl transferase AbiEii/AbiGii toxin family protein [Bacillota bacterium]
MIDTIASENMLEICRLVNRESFMQDYYLAGGTALAMQLLHRKSNDLDFFAPGGIRVDRVIDWLHGVFAAREVNIVFRGTDQLDVRIMHIRTSFNAYPFQVINGLISGERIDPRLSGLKIAPPEEIALMKAYAIGRRT